MQKLNILIVIASLLINLVAPAANTFAKNLETPPVTSEPICGQSLEVDLLRNPVKHYTAGKVTVSNGETKLFVTYTTTTPWKLIKTNLTVENSLGEIPTRLNGNPWLEKFDHRKIHLKVTEYTYEIPLNGLASTVYIAAHAQVLKTGTTRAVNAWGEGTPFVPSRPAAGSYFTYDLQACNEPPVANNDASAVNEDDPATMVDVLANDTDPNLDPFTIASASDPANGTVVVALDGLSLTYQPDANYCNDGITTDDFTYSLSPGGSTATVAMTVSCVDDPPGAANDTATVAEEASATTVDVLANDGDPDGGGSFSIASVTQPTNGTVAITNAGADLTYQPNANYCNDGSPTDDFTYTLTPGGSTATVAVTVTCVDDDPTAVNDSATVSEDANATTIDVLANDSDLDGGPISITSVTQPANGTVVITNSGADLTYEPDANYCNDGSPTDDFTYTISPGGSTATVAVTITCGDDAPTAVNDAATVDEDANATTINVLANDTDTDGGAISIASITQPTNGTVTITNSGADLTYEPDADYCNDGSPLDTFTYTLTPGSSTATVSVTVTCVEDPLNAANDTATVNEDSAATTIDVMANDVDPDGGSSATSIDSVTQPANGTVAITNGGADLTYQPDANYCNDGSPTDDFTYTLTPGGSTATVAVTVTCVDDDPTAVNDAATVVEDSGANTIDVLANDTDQDSGPISIASVTQPANGAVAITNGGADLTYQPNANYCNNPPGSTTDTFTYTLTPGGTSATVSVTVTCGDDAPTAVNDAATVGEDSGANTINVLANDTDTDGGAMSIASVTQPANGTVTITNSGADLTYEPDANYCNNPPGSTTDNFTYTLTPGSSTATVSVTVTCVDDNPVAVSDSATVIEDSSANTINVLANDTDIDGGPISITSITQPANGTVALTVDETGITYTPNANYCNGGSPTDTFTYSLMPGGSTTSVHVTATCVNDAPTATVPGAQTGSEDTDLIFSTGNLNMLSVADIDAGSGNVEVSLSVINGTIIPSIGSGASITGSGTASVTITGTLSQVNAALSLLRYKGNLNFNSRRGSETLTLTINDQGNHGTGGPLSDTETVEITLIHVNDAPVALTKNFSAQANMKITGLSGLLTGATDPDTGDSGYTASFTVGTVGPTTTPSGGTISNLNTTAGSFDFDPPPGASGNVTFTYTVCDSGNPGPSACSAPTTITVNVAGPVIWFVNPTVAGPGDGRLSNPFKFLSGNSGANNDADDVDASGHRIFVYSGTASGGITLNSDEWLIGQGVTGTTFDTLFSISPPSGTIARPSINGARPAIQGNVVMTTSDAVRGLNITPSSGTEGLTASSASSLTVGEVSVTTANAMAVNLVSSGGTISLTTVNANGGNRGILLNSTTGTFTVTGTGGTCTTANTSGCTGGTIQNMTGADDSTATPVGTGIVLNNAAGVSLTRMHIHDHTNYALRGTSVSGFTLDNSVINGANGGSTPTSGGSPFNDSSIYFTNLTGSATIGNTSISGGFTNNFKLVNTTGTLDRLTFHVVNIGANSTNEGNDGIGIEGQGASVVKVTVQNSTFTSARGDLLGLGHNGTGTLDLVFSGNTLSNNHPGIATGGGGVTLGSGSTSTATMSITNNTFRDAVGHAILIVKDIGAGSQTVTFTGNTVGVSSVLNSGSLEGSDLKIHHAGGGGTQTVLVNNNFFYQYNNDAVLFQAGAGIATSGAFNITVTGNTISNAGNNPNIGLIIQGINLNGGVTPGDSFAICAQIGGAGADKNDVDSAVGSYGGGDYRLRQRQSTTVRLPGYAGSATDTAAVATFVNGNNIVSGSGTASVSSPPGGGFVGGAACPTP